ncbi:cytidylate kinase [Breoghania corrubedonensis]|uniref:Cytidylate kinase n=1 Tax=Breoghania corrubedonensis TaxID=665038 RepID=A0A2T5VG63_9HYPH|nr:(d)CMP kinase [Breoghania corrubedonensis]PTW62742.1 cytidylate kinase [Breoghania corrubedonensis]
MIIAIDGPAASGKGTLARRLAERFGLNHLDTGLTYRAVAAKMLAEGLPLDDEAQAAAAAASLDFSTLEREALSLHEIGEAASRIAVMPSVRRALVEGQRRFAQVSPGAVLDGRDIGTVVCPKADVKLFVTASPQVRARRRTDELQGRGIAAAYDDILADLIRRDERDSTRNDSPLRPADDAHLLDTSEMDIETAFRKAVDIVGSL